MFLRLLRRFGRRAFCQMVDEQLEAYLDGALPPSRSWAITTHLEECPDCRALVRREKRRLEQFRGVGGPARAVPSQVSAQMRRNVGRRLYWRSIMRQTQRSLQGVVAVAILVAVTTGVFLWWQSNQPLPDVDPDSTSPALLPDEEGRRITFAARSQSQSQYEAVMAQFHETHPNIRVQFVPYSTGLGRPLTALEQAEAADTMLLGFPLQTDPAGYFVELNPFLDASPALDRALFWPDALSGCQAGDAVYGLPLLLNFNLLFYDRAAFEAAGLPVPEPGWTWPEFVRAVETLTQRQGDRTTRYGFANLDRLLLMLEPVLEQSLSGESVTVERLQPFLGDVERLVLENRVAVADDPDLSQQELNNLIRDGRAAMWLESPATLETRRQQLGDGINVAPIPAFGELDRTTAIFTTCAAISAGAADREAAWTWLSFLANNYPTGTDRGGVPAHRARAMGQDSAALAEDAPSGYVLRHAWYPGDRRAVDALRHLMHEALAAGEGVDGAVADFTPGSPPTPEAPPGPVVVESPPAPPQSGAQHIRFYDFLPALSFYNGPLREFHERNPHIRVTVSADLPGSLTTEGYNITDVAQHYDCLNWPFTTPGLADYSDFTMSDHVLSLSPLLDAAPADFHDDFYPGTLDYLIVDGELVGLPLGIQPLVVRYNSRYFAENGFEPPPAEWTATDLFALAAQLARPAETQQQTVYGYTTAFAGGHVDPLEWLAAAEGRPLWDLSSGPPAVYLDDPGVAAVLRTWTALVEQAAVYPITGAGSRTQPEAADPFRLIDNDRAAMWLAQVRWLLNEAPDGSAGLAAMPDIHGEAPPPMLSALFISRQSEHRDACWEWITFLTGQPLINPGIPARLSTMHSEAWESAVGAENAAVLRLTLERHLAQVNLDAVEQPIAGPLRRWLADVLMAAYAGDSLDPLLAVAQQKADAYLDCLAPLDAPTTADADRCAQQADPDYLPMEELFTEP